MPVMVPDSRSSWVGLPGRRGNLPVNLISTSSTVTTMLLVSPANVAVSRLSSFRMPNSSSELRSTASVATKVVMRQPRPVPHAGSNPRHRARRSGSSETAAAGALPAQPNAPAHSLRWRRRQAQELWPCRYDRSSWSPLAHAQGRPRHDLTPPSRPHANGRTIGVSTDILISNIFPGRCCSGTSTVKRKRRPSSACRHLLPVRTGRS